MRLLLIVLFIVVPIAELALLIQVGSWIGFWPTLALLVLDAVLGSMLMRSQGRAAWRRFNAAIEEGRAPAREALDGVLVIFGGALLLTPGFITDIFGLLFLIPPTRVLVRRLIVRRATLRVMRVATPPGSNGRPQDVDGTAVDIEPDQLDRPQ
jgi:UPF0716 protein FxsA